MRVTGGENLQVQLTLVVTRDGRVERMEQATIESPAAERVLQNWRPDGMPLSAPAVGWRTTPGRVDWVAAAYLGLAGLCAVLSGLLLWSAG